jgi:hypothetical protein
MAKLGDNAQRVWDRLPEDCTKVGGITLQRELELSKTEYKQARDELKERDLVESGAGRGGSLGRREGVKPEEGPSLKKRMEMAREAKAANTKDRRRTTELKEIVRDFMRQQGFSQVDNEHITFAGLDFEKPLIEVWTDSAAQIYTIKPLEWSQLRAKKTS